MKKVRLSSLNSQTTLNDVDKFVMTTGKGLTWGNIVKAIKIGGRNLWPGSRRVSTVVIIGIYGYSSPVKYISEIGLKSGDQIIFSIYVSDIPTGESVRARIDLIRPDGTYIQFFGSNIVSVEGLALIDLILPDISVFNRINYRVSPVSYKTDYEVNIIHEKLECGNIPTEWSPAWEDLQFKQ